MNFYNYHKICFDYAPICGNGGLSNAAIHLAVTSISVFHTPSSVTMHFIAMVTTSRKPHARLEVEPLVSMSVWLLEVAEMATKPSLVLLCKHSLGGCTISILPVKLPSVEGILFHCTIPCASLFTVDGLL